MLSHSIIPPSHSPFICRDHHCNSPMNDPYTILGVPKDASKMTIKSAFRRLAKQWHPDKDKDNPLYHQKFQEINEAYHLLMNEKRRKQFDTYDIQNIFRRMRRNPADAYADAQSHKSYNSYDNVASSIHTENAEIHEDSPSRDMPATKQFSALLKKREWQNRKNKTDTTLNSRKTSPAAGRDIHYSVEIPPNDAMNGTKKPVRLFNGQWVEVIIPPQTKDKQVLRLKGKGLQGENNGARGDLLMTVHVKEPDLFRVEGERVYLDVPLTLTEALEGCRIPVPTLLGPVLLSIPAGVNHGHTLRLKGKGMLTEHKVRGDFFAVVRIVMPPGADANFKKWIADWEEKHPYDVRKHFSHLV